MRLVFPPELHQPRAIDPTGTKLCFNPQELVVLGDSIRPTGAAGLDLPAVGRDGDVGDCGVLGFTGPVTEYTRPAGTMSHRDSRERLGQGADLVDLDQDAIGASL